MKRVRRSTLLASAALLVLLLSAAASSFLPQAGFGPWTSLLHGSRPMLVAGIGGVLAGLPFAVILGGLGAQLGIWDGVFRRITECVGAFPFIITVALFRLMEARPSLLSLVLALAVLRIPETARVVRAASLKVQASDIAMGSRALGASPWQLFERHVLPTTMGSLAASLVEGIGLLVALEASLSFVGLGIPSDLPSWGAMAATAAEHGNLTWVLIPGLAVVTTVGALYVVAKDLQEFNPGPSS